MPIPSCHKIGWAFGTFGTGLGRRERAVSGSKASGGRLGAVVTRGGALVVSSEEVMEAHTLYATLKPLLIVYALLTPAVVITLVFLHRKKDIVYTMTDHRGYKLVVTLDCTMNQDERRTALRELGLRPLEYKTKHLPKGVFKVQVMNAHEYDNA